MTAPSPEPVEAPVERKSRAVLWLVAALTLLAWLAGTATLSWLLVAYPKQAGPGEEREIPMEVPATMGMGALSNRLAREGAIEQPRWFAAYACLMGACDRMRRGAISVNPGLSPAEQLLRIARMPGQSTSVRVTVPEGFTRFAIAERMARRGVCQQEDFLRASSDPKLMAKLEIPAATAEGYLFPDTYEFTYGGGADAVVRTMVRTFKRRTQPVFDAAGDPDGLPWTPHQRLILASIVEKEAQRASERPVIAGVFANRLRDPAFRPKRLQADPTVGYGCLVDPTVAPSCAQYDGRRILPTMLRDPANPYNTYRHDGLPPGPIANPGLGALKAAVKPATHAYFYFVATGGGAHTFSRTLAEHNAAIRGER